MNPYEGTGSEAATGRPSASPPAPRLRSCRVYLDIESDRLTRSVTLPILLIIGKVVVGHHEHRQLLTRSPRDLADSRRWESLTADATQGHSATEAPRARRGGGAAEGRHGLRATELVSLQWSQIDLKGATVTINRAKGGMATQHPLRAVELRLLGKLRREVPEARYVLMSERGTPWSTSNWRKILQRLATTAKLPIAVNPHALRHACGFYLAGKGVDTRALSHYLGHRSLQSSERYTAQSAARFKDFWRD
jgi:hypothetical protein